MENTPSHPHRRQTDQILEGWTWGRVTKIATGIAAVGGIVVAVVSFLLGIFVTRPMLEKTQRKSDSTWAVLGRRLDGQDEKLRRIEEHQESSDSTHRLLIPMARVQCLELERDNSLTVARGAGLPCERLTR